jgi:ribonuclease HI/probable phosphoglycerate mutase
MSASDLWTITTDGAARGNPGPAAIAFIIERAGEKDIQHKESLGEATNNVAEYTALIRALEKARDLGGKRLVIQSDSDLMVQQMKGRYKVKNPGLLALHEKARHLCKTFEDVSFRHIPREENTRADRLCNQALDGEGKSASKTKAKASAGKVEQVRQTGVECLRSMAAEWAKGNPQHPKPEDAWDQLWSILEEAGVLRS